MALKFTIYGRNRVNIQTTIGYMKNIIDAVECMHIRGFAHRDIKLENVLFDEEQAKKEQKEKLRERQKEESKQELKNLIYENDETLLLFF